jgi:K+-sensing histidine kinase KdpD
MSIVRGAISLAVTLAILAAVTALLWYGKVLGIGPHHPVFVYLFPIALIAVLFGSLPAIVCAVIAAGCAAFFLYEPIYSFHVNKHLEYGDLICFAVLALITVKCTVELMRPAPRLPMTKPRYQRP